MGRLPSLGILPLEGELEGGSYSCWFVVKEDLTVLRQVTRSGLHHSLSQMLVTLSFARPSLS